MVESVLSKHKKVGLLPGNWKRKEEEEEGGREGGRRR